MSRPYDHKEIEKKWQDKWMKEGAFAASDDIAKPKYYPLIEFPYPSGAGLHVGHPRPYIALDIIARKRRREGFNVLYPIGWDAFGLPTENYALKTGKDPRLVTKENSDTFRRQIQSLGISFDWSREINTTDPKYYKWTQWIFLQLYKHGLAYKGKATINWCPKDKIGLANEEVVDGKCERCGTQVEKRDKEQWMLAITKYAKRLYDDLDTVDYIERAKTQQRNWIGPSEGAEIDFSLSGLPDVKRFVVLHGKGGSPEGIYFPWLKKNLEGRGYEVQMPQMPGGDEPNDEIQAEYALKNCTFDENTAIIGQSFGGIVALRLLEKGVKVNRVTLAATPYSGKYLDGKERSTVTAACERGFDFEKIKNQAKGFIVLSDANDRVVPKEDGESFAQKLDGLLITGRSDVGHFGAKTEPDVLLASTPTIRVFTTRPDTLFGATFLALAPEHPWVTLALDEKHIVLGNKEEVRAYVDAARKKTDVERGADGKEKTGVELKGVKAINPANNEEIPIWVADFVLGGFGTGALFGDAHDERDVAFAKKYDIPLKPTLKPLDGSDDTAIRNLEICYTGKGILYDSGEFSGMTSDEAIPIVGAKFGRMTTAYKLRDWVFSRQRYWGEPIPMINCETCGLVPVPESDLPVELPKVEKYEPTDTGESPLANITEWVNTKCAMCGGPARRETDVMPNWAGSSWYYLRYTDPANDTALAAPEKLKYWTPVDWYNGGMEHTVLHLLYSRFWHKFLFDIGIVPTAEPYKKRTSHGVILAEDGTKMSKSKGNVVNPDEMVERFGADSLRVYEMFMGPFDQAIAWSTDSVVGMYRFLERVWGLSEKITDEKVSGEVELLMNQSIKKVSEDIENMKFNTALSQLMIFANVLQKLEKVPREAYENLLKLLAPFAPHMTEELWQESGHASSIHAEMWSAYDAAKLEGDTVTIAVQIGGRSRGAVAAPRGASQEEVLSVLKSDPRLGGLVPTNPSRIVFVADKVINIIP